MTPAAFDITLAVIMLLSIGFAFWRGLISEVFSIVGMISAVIGAWKGGPLLEPYFKKWLHVPKDGGDQAAEAVSKGASSAAAGHEIIDAATQKAHLIFGLVSPGLAAKACAFGAAFLAVFLVMMMIGYIISRGVEEAGLGVLDRLGGAAFGAARGFAVIFLPFVLCTVLMGPEHFPDWAKNSASVPILERAYVYADQRFAFSDMVKERGDTVVLQLEKVDPSKLIEPAAGENEGELKDEISKEEQEKTP